MVYTNEMKKKLDAILKAFENYIDGQNYFDIIYSQKAGYLYFVVDTPDEAGPRQLNTPEDMLDVLFNEVINDVIYSPGNQSHNPDSRTLSEWEEAESRRRLTAILKTIKDEGDRYLNRLDRYIKDYQNCYAGDGAPC